MASDGFSRAPAVGRGGWPETLQQSQESALAGRCYLGPRPLRGGVVEARLTCPPQRRGPELAAGEGQASRPAVSCVPGAGRGVAAGEKDGGGTRKAVLIGAPKAGGELGFQGAAALLLQAAGREGSRRQQLRGCPDGRPPVKDVRTRTGGGHNHGSGLGRGRRGAVSWDRGGGGECRAADKTRCPLRVAPPGRAGARARRRPSAGRARPASAPPPPPPRAGRGGGCAQAGAGAPLGPGCGGARGGGRAGPTCAAGPGGGRRRGLPLPRREVAAAAAAAAGPAPQRRGRAGAGPLCRPARRESLRAAPWGRIRAGPRWCCSSPPRCSPSRPGCSSTGGPRPCGRRGGAGRRRRPGPGRCSPRCSPSGPYESSGSGPGCEPSTARRAGTGYGGARAGGGGRREVGGSGVGFWAGGAGCPLLSGSGEASVAGRRRGRRGLGRRKPASLFEQLHAGLVGRESVTQREYAAL